MADDDALLLELADVILDARPLDWAAASERVADSQRHLLAHFQSVAGLTSFHLQSSIHASSAYLAQQALSHGTGGAATAVESAPIEPPAEWGPLTIVGRIGRGRFGDVYRAVDRRLDRPVALKLLRVADATSVRDESTVVDEARLLARVRHPNVVTVYGAERIDGRVGLWMEFIDGRTLAHDIAEHERLPWEDVCRIGIDLAGALGAVHRAGLLHRDIKAQNILRDADGRVVLADFGAGQILTNALEEPVDLAGTPLYLAPEIFRGAPATRQSDLYSLGVLLFHLITGSYPVRGRSFSDLREAHADERRSHLRDACPHVPPGLIEIVDRALSVDPDARFASADVLRDALHEVIDAVDTRREVLSLPAQAPARPSPRSASPLYRRAAIAGFFVAVALVSTVLIARPWSRTTAPTNGTKTAAGDDEALALRKIRLPSFEMGRPSQDGRVFPYFDQANALQLWEVTTGRSRQLTDPAPSGESGGRSVASPTADRIAYGWALGGGVFELRAVNADGTWPRVLIRRQGAFEPVPVDWSSNGQEVLAWLRQKNGSADLVLVPLDGTAPRVVWTMSTGAPSHASLSPDGRFVVTARPDDSGGSHHLVIVRTDAGEPRVLMSDVVADVGPLWTPDGQHVVFVRAQPNRREASDAWIVRVADGVPQEEPTVLATNLGAWPIALAGANQLYQLVSAGLAEVYTASIDLTGTNPAGPPSRISPLEVGNRASPSWSPDGNRIAYFTTTERGIPGAVEVRTLTVQDIPSGDIRKLSLPLPWLSGYSPKWALDSQSVVVFGRTEAVETRFTHYRVDVSSGAMETMGVSTATTQPPYSQFAPDGEHYLYIDLPRGIVSRRLSDGAERVVIAPRQGWDIERFVIAPDAHAIACASSSERQGSWITSIAVKEPDRAARVLAQQVTPLRLMLHAWTPDSRDVIYSEGHTSNPYKLWRIPETGGPAVDLRFSTPPAANPITLSPDGRQIAYPERVIEPELWIRPVQPR